MIGIKKIIKDQKGQSMVEFALILPILIVMIFGILEFGRIYYAQIVLTRSAREAVRLCAVGKTDDEVVQRIYEITPLPDLAQNLNIEYISPPQEERKTGDPVTVKISYKLTLIAPFISNFLGNPLTLKAEATMRME